MDTNECLKAPARPGFMPELLALAVSTGVLYHFRFGGSPLDDDTLTCYLQLFIATHTLFLGLTLLPLRLIANSLPSPTLQRWIHHLGTATLAATFATLALVVTNSALFSPQAVLWASEWGLIVIAIAVAFKLISATTPMSCFQQYIEVGIFCLCVAVAGVYNEPLGSMASTTNFSSIVYRTYQAHRFGLVPCTFALAVLLLIIGVAVPGDSVIHFVPVTFKEVFAALTLSVGCVTLLTGASLAVCASILSSAMVIGVGPGGALEAIMVGAP